MGGLLNFVGGVAGAAADTASTRMKNAEDEATQVRRDERQNDLALKRERSVAELRQEFARADDDRKREQSAADGQAINNGAGEVNRARMAGLINSRNGSSMTADDAKVLENNPDAIKAYGMEPRSRSQEYDDKINVAEGRGLMGQAKELRGQQDVEIRRTHEENQTAKNDAQNAINNRRLDQQQEFNNARASIQDRLAAVAEARMARMESKQGQQMEKAELQSTRLSLTSVLTDISKEADRIQVLRSTAMDPAQTSLYDKQLETLRKDQGVARGRLNELAGVAPSQEAKPAPPPGPWNKFGKGDVQPAAAVESKAAIPVPQRFNEAGYTDVQSTIDGARRGDGKALNLLQSLIRQGATTPAQRQQISEITKAK